MSLGTISVWYLNEFSTAMIVQASSAKVGAIPKILSREVVPRTPAPQNYGRTKKYAYALRSPSLLKKTHTKYSSTLVRITTMWQDFRTERKVV